jgi:hypothetical protein
MVIEALNTTKAAGAQAENILVRGDSAYCSGSNVTAVVKAGAGPTATAVSAPVQRVQRDRQPAATPILEGAHVLASRRA